MRRLEAPAVMVIRPEPSVVVEGLVGVVGGVMVVVGGE
jgi:hypothetical protein